MSECHPILYSFKRCPYAIRARMALAFAKISHIHREINLRDKHPTFLETSPKGTVPVWVDIKNQRIIDESIDIVRYAFTQHTPNGWETPEVLNDKQFLELYDQLIHKFIPATRQIKYNHSKTNNALETETTQANQLLKALNLKFEKQSFIFRKPSPADIILFPNIRQLTIHDPMWCARHQMPNLKRWIDHWSSHQVFKNIFVNQPVWATTQTPIIISYQ